MMRAGTCANCSGRIRQRYAFEVFLSIQISPKNWFAQIMSAKSTYNSRKPHVPLTSTRRTLHTVSGSTGSIELAEM
jgi:hypothetical protein